MEFDDDQDLKHEMNVNETHGALYPTLPDVTMSIWNYFVCWQVIIGQQMKEKNKKITPNQQLKLDKTTNHYSD